MPSKPKTPQKEDLHSVSGRDSFQTPNYAVDLLVPFLRELQGANGELGIWECASGLDKIVYRLGFHGFDSFGTDLISGTNFLTDVALLSFNCIVTNPPFSLKRKFYEKCRSYGVPFALLIPADYSSWIIRAIQDGAEKIIPERRIDYITPTGKKSSAQFHSMWLTWGFDIGRTETFVKLSNEEKATNI